MELLNVEGVIRALGSRALGGSAANSRQSVFLLDLLPSKSSGPCQVGVYDAVYLVGVRLYRNPTIWGLFGGSH